MKKMTQNKPLLEQDKQSKPLRQEVSAEDARVKAALYAAIEKGIIKRK